MPPLTNTLLECDDAYTAFFTICCRRCSQATVVERVVRRPPGRRHCKCPLSAKTCRRPVAHGGIFLVTASRTGKYSTTVSRTETPRKVGARCETGGSRATVAEVVLRPDGLAGSSAAAKPWATAEVPGVCAKTGPEAPSAAKSFPCQGRRGAARSLARCCWRPEPRTAFAIWMRRFFLEAAPVVCVSWYCTAWCIASQRRGQAVCRTSLQVARAAVAGNSKAPRR